MITKQHVTLQKLEAEKSLYWKRIKLRGFCIHTDYDTYVTRSIFLMGRMREKDT